jgi:hypothetical protein
LIYFTFSFRLNNVQYFLAGSASLISSAGSSSSAASVKWSMEQKPAFVVVNVTRTVFTVNYVGSSSSIVYSHSLYRKRSPKPIVPPDDRSPKQSDRKLSAAFLATISFASVFILVLISVALVDRLRPKRQTPKIKATKSLYTNNSRYPIVNIGNSEFKKGHEGGSCFLTQKLTSSSSNINNNFTRRAASWRDYFKSYVNSLRSKIRSNSVKVVKIKTNHRSGSNNAWAALDSETSFLGDEETGPVRKASRWCRQQRSSSF